MLQELNKYHIILASNSPRRKELLSGLGISFEVRVLPDIDETYPIGLQSEEIPLYIAKAKANAYRTMMNKNDLLITADTIVWVKGEVLGKPCDEAHARIMLRKLSGTSHEVITGVCLRTHQTNKEFAVTTTVNFKPLNDEEIDYYVSHYHPLDKAGAYGIQEWIGYIGVTSLQGSYYNVMGLPIQRLYQELQNIAQE